MATVIDDDERDVMTGSSGRDWFFADLTEDKITDLHDDEFADVLDWILTEWHVFNDPKKPRS